MLRRSLVALSLLILAPLALSADEICSSHWHRGSVTHVYSEAETFVGLAKPGFGNNPGDCSTNAFTCEILRCETEPGSEFACLSAPGGACVDYRIETCFDSSTFIRLTPVIKAISLVHPGPCSRIPRQL